MPSVAPNTPELVDPQPAGQLLSSRRVASSLLASIVLSDTMLTAEPMVSPASPAPDGDAAPQLVEPPLLRMIAEPVQVTPGEVITYSVAINNVAAAPLSGVVLSSTLPTGVVFVPNSASGFVYSPRDRRLTWDIARLQPRQGLLGGFQLRATGLALGELITATVGAASALTPLVTATTVVEVAPPARNQEWATPGEGAWLRSEDRRVDLRVSPGAVERATQFSYVAQSTLPRPLPGLVLAFKLQATDDNGQPVRTFGRPVRLSVFYRAHELPGTSSGEKGLFYYDERSEQWVRLPNAVDDLQRRLWMHIDHFTLFAVAKVDVTDRLKGLLQPHVLGLETNLWSGTSSFAYPLDLPPAPAGNVPPLALVYSSEAANQMMSADLNVRRGQASPLGLGWSLQGSGAITRDNKGRYYIEFQGGSYRLENTGSNNQWHTIPESFLQITHVGIDAEFGQEFMYGSCPAGYYLGKVSLRAKDTLQWTVRTPDGTVYTFGSQVDNDGLPSDLGKTALQWSGNPVCSVGNVCVATGNGQSCGAANLRPYRWNLESVQPPAGPGWSLAYDYTTADVKPSQSINNMCEVINWNAMNSEARRYVRDTRLTRITYGDGHSAVDLSYYVPEGHRSDVPDGFGFGVDYDCDQQWIVSDHLAERVVVRSRGNTDPWNTTTHVRRVYNTGLYYGPDYGGTNETIDNAQLREIIEWDRLNSTTPDPPWMEFTYYPGIGTTGSSASSITEPMKSDTSSLGGNVTVDQQRMGCGSGGPPPLACDGGAPQNGRIVVAARTVSSFPGQDESRQTYNYAGGNYVNLNPLDPNNPFWQFYGFDTATERLYTPGVSTPIRKTVTLFSQENEQRKGKVNQVTVYSGESGPELTKTINTWSLGVWTIGSSTTEHNYPQLDVVEEYLEGQRVVQRHLYYETWLQGGQNGRQFGNVTKIEERAAAGNGWATDPLRTSYTWYYPNFSVWNSPPPSDAAFIVNKPGKMEQFNACDGCTDGRRDSQTTYFYDGASSYDMPPTQGLLTKQEAETLVARVEYDPINSNVLKQIDGKGNSTQFYYDSQFAAFPVCVVNDSGHTTMSRFYGVAGSSDAGCLTEDGSAAFDANGQPISGASFGQIEDVTDANDALTSTTYDAWGRLATVWRPGDERAQGHGATEITLYTNYVDATAPFKVQRRQRDDAGGGNAATYLDSYTFYDGLGRVIQTQAEAASSGQSILASTQYNSQGLVAVTNTPYIYSAALGTYRTPDWTQHRSETSYDALGRPTLVVLKSGSTQVSQMRTYYQGRRTAVIDPANHQTISETDPLGRLATVSQYTGTFAGEPGWNASVYAQSRYGYDSADRLVDAWDPVDNHTDIEYDLAGRKTRMTDPDMGEWQYRWDAAGNLRKQLDARNMLTCFNYDSLNRLTSKTFHPDTADPSDVNCSQQQPPYPVSYSYDESGHGDSIGRRTSMVSMTADSRSDWSYDARGRMIGETQTITPTGFTTPLVYQTDWTYDAADRVRTTTYPDTGSGREIVTTAYNSQGLPVSLSSNSGGDYVSSTTYDALGRLTTQTLGNDNFVQRNYWAWDQTPGSGRLKRIFVHDTALETTAYMDLVYHYDAAGNVRRIIDTTNDNQQECFEYDELNRLTHGFTNDKDDINCEDPYDPDVGVGAYDEAYAYDPAGRMTGKGDLLYHYNATQPVHAPDSVADASFDYDAAGNLLTGRQDAYDNPMLTYTQAWDQENRLAVVDAHIGTTTLRTTMAYDGDGRRAWKQRLDTTNVYPGAHFEHMNLPASPLAVNVDWFEATEEEDHNLVTWITVDESHTVGYNLYRGDDPGELGQRLNVDVIPAHYYGQSMGDTYTFADYDAPQGETVWYWLEELTDEPATLLHGPVTPGGGPAMAQRTPETTAYDSYRSTYFLGSQRIALRQTVPVFGQNESYYVFTDHLGTVRLETYGDGFYASGDVRASTPTLPYGGARTGEPVSHHWFTGQYLDRAEDLYDYGARPYDSTLGLFIQADTVVPNPGDPQSLNRYSYVGNRPLTFVDPSGHVGVCFYGGPASGDADPNDMSTTSQLCSNLFREGLLGKEWNPFNNRAKDVMDAYDYVLKVLATADAGEPVVIVGYSWGGGAALELAKMLNEAGDTPVTVDTLVTVDPVAWSRGIEFDYHGISIPGAVIGSRKSAYNTSEVSDNVLWAINVYAGAQNSPISEGIENLRGALNVQGRNPEGGEATHFSLMNVERGDLNLRTRDQIIGLMQNPWLRFAR